MALHNFVSNNVRNCFFSSPREALSARAPIAQDLQQEHHRDQLQLHHQYSGRPIFSQQEDPIWEKRQIKLITIVQVQKEAVPYVRTLLIEAYCSH